MSLAQACGWTLLRSLLIAACAIPICFEIRRQLAARQGIRRVALWTLLLIPFFAPDLLVGYAYYNFSLSLIRHPVWNELFYALLVFFKVVPVGAVIAVYTPPPPISAQALHCRRMAIGSGTSRASRLLKMLGFYTRGPLRGVLPAGLLMFLLAFQEFELVSLVNATSWTVWLFDQQATGLPILETLRYGLFPLACQAAVICGFVPMIFKSRLDAGRRELSSGPPSVISTGLLWGVLCAGCCLLCLIPFVILTKGTLAGWAVLFKNSRLFREIAVGLGMAILAASFAYGSTILFLPAAINQRPNKIRVVMISLLSMPGLFGGLTIGLTMLSLFQTKILNRWYDTPLPWILALVLFLLPRALILRLILAAARRREPIYLAQLVAQGAKTKAQRSITSRLNWQLRYRGHFWSIVLLGWWGYLDPTLPSLLRPSGLDPAPMRLYNFMHYGQTGGLSAMLAVTLLIPILVIVAASVLLPIVFRRVG